VPVTSAALDGAPQRIRRGLRLVLTHVQWPLLVGADGEAPVAAFRRLVGRGWLVWRGARLWSPGEAWPVYSRA